nr:PAS domain-containing protein [Methanobacterium formicicum]
MKKRNLNHLKTQDPGVAHPSGGNEKYQNALDNMMEGCQIISPDWRYIYVNDAALHHAQLEREALIGHTMMEVYPGIDETEMFWMLEKKPWRKVNQIIWKITSFTPMALADGLICAFSRYPKVFSFYPLISLTVSR